MEQQMTEYLKLHNQIHKYPPKWFTSIALTNIPKESQRKYQYLLDGKGSLVNKFYDIYMVSSPGTVWNGNRTYEQRIAAAGKKVNRDALGAKIHARLMTLQNPAHFDFGSGDGTTALATSRVISAAKTYCCDVDDFMLAENKQYCDFSKITATDELIIPKDVNIITAAHVFHHLACYNMIQTRLREMYDGLPKGGLLLVREHDVAASATSEIDTRLRKYNKEVVVLMHLCYEVNEIPKRKTRAEFDAWFHGMDMCLMTKQELRQFAEGVGFTFVADSTARASDLSYYILFEKI
uniref:Methyltransferase type 11 domain-containing protein n=1 Tax=viral metagenome TaxID=1070528 RepID=A0A6C0C6V3_9ZZZZ